MPRVGCCRVHHFGAILVASFVVLISLSVPVFAAAVSFGPKEPAWLQLFPQGTSPAARAGYSLVLDTARNRLLMFGGYDGTYRNDLWALSLSGTPTWTQITPSGPPVGRSDHTAIYDPVRDRLWIFAGSDASGYRHDVYYLALASPTAWAPVTPAGTAPGNRRSHTAVYDPVADRMIVFGGYVYLNDTWTLSLSGTPTWTQLTPTGGPPSARQGHSACWDVAGNRMIVFGGDNGPNYLNDVWSLSFSGGAHWTSLSPSGVAPSGGRRFHASAYDQAGNRFLCYGGQGDPGNQLFSEVWSLSLDGSLAWSQLLPSGPSPGKRTDVEGAYDGANDRMVVFGGSDSAGTFRNDVWALTKTGSVPSPADSDCPVAIGLANDGSSCFSVVVRDFAHNPIAGSTVAIDFGSCLLEFCPTQPPGVTIVGSTVSSVTDGAGGAAFCICACVNQSCTATISADGVTLCSVPVNHAGPDCTAPPDTCLSPGWQLASLTGPQPRHSSAMATHDSRSTILLFGGNDGSSNLGDTWEWGGSEWFSRPAAAGMLARSGHAMAYDRSRGQTVLFGGSGSGGLLGDTWEWDAGVWIQRSSSGPSPRFGHAMAYDEIRQQVILFGGNDGSVKNDTWAWNGTTWSLINNSGPSPRMDVAMASDPERSRRVVRGENQPEPGFGSRGHMGVGWHYLGGANPDNGPTLTIAPCHDLGRELRSSCHDRRCRNRCRRSQRDLALERDGLAGL